VALMDSRDWRRWHIEFSHFTPPALQTNLALRDRLRPIAARRDSTVAAVAVAWVLSWPGVTGAIVGPRSPDQVDGWISAAAFSLTDEAAEGELTARPADAVGEETATAAPSFRTPARPPSPPAGADLISALQKLPRHHHPLDLVGALVDLGHPGSALPGQACGTGR
jgi:hypothetical protein